MRALQAERIFRIVELMQARRVVTFAELLRTLECSRATLKRDLAFLRDRLGAEFCYDHDARAYLYTGRGSSRWERADLIYGSMAEALRKVVTVMERCEPSVPERDRATDGEWIAALAAARAALGRRQLLAQPTR